MSIHSIPSKGWSLDQMQQHVSNLRIKDIQWQNGRAFCLVYYPGKERYEKVKTIFNMFLSDNGLNPTATPSLTSLECDVLSICNKLFNGDDNVRGNITSGGTESILLSIKTARDWAKDKRKIDTPHVVIAESAHPAFFKAFKYFNVAYTVIKNQSNGQADPKEIAKSIQSNTIMLVASAPSYPYGIIDPIEDIASIAKSKNLLFHVDACVGGFMLPFLKKLGHPIPKWDFSVDGVTSISADIHKYGYSPKGASVIMYKNAELRNYQFSVYTEWIGGVYGSPTILGTRPGGCIAGAWAALVGIGEDGYLEMAQVTMATTEKIKKGIQAIPELQIVGNPDMTLVAFQSDKINIFDLADELNKKGWHFDKQQHPSSIHLSINYIHKDYADEFLADLQDAVTIAKQFSLGKVGNKIAVGLVKGLSKVLPEGTIASVQKLTQSSDSMSNTNSTAAMYGMMGALSGTGDLEDIVIDFLDKTYTPNT